MNPDAISHPAMLDVVPTGVAATHAVQSYSTGGTGGTVSISNQFAYAGPITNLQWSVPLPTGWSLAGTDATGAGTKPATGAPNLLEWQWSALPASPVAFSYSLSLPKIDLAPQSIAALVGFNHESTPIQVTAKLDPLMIGFRHGADTNRDGRLSLLELTRVIELYNPRHGTVRTGGYAVQAGTEDGFAPGP